MAVLQIPIFPFHGSPVNLLSNKLCPPFTNCFGLSNTNNYRTSSKKAAVLFKLSATQQQQQHTSRPLANFPLGLWRDFFTNISISDSALESLCTQTDVLKEEAKKTFLDSASDPDPMESIKFINLLYRLGLSYHFETEIEQQFNQIFSCQLSHLLDEINGYDLQSTATAFLVFREHGYKIPCDVFNKFKDDAGKFKESLSSDIKGLLSLYEASFLSCHGEDILDEARIFTTARLEMLVNDHDHQEHLNIKIDPHVRRFIMDALKLPMHKGVVRLQVRKYINLYQHEETRNETLLKFAKIDYNRVQLLHRQEMSDLSKWWNELNIAAELPHGRNRLVEMYFWINGLHFEPHYSRARIMGTKIMTLITYVDDTYDAYGTHNERKLFNEAIQRWDYDYLDQLPADYLKKLFKAFLDTFCEFENEVMAEGRSFAVDYTKEAAKDAVKGYYLESEWIKEDYVYVPSLEEYFGPKEYFGPALLTCCIPLMSALSFMGMGKIAGAKEFEWLLAKPKICRASALFGRILDDTSTHKFEQERIHIASSVECYMKEYRVSEEKAIQELKKMAENEWKNMNEELMMRPHEVPVKLLHLMVNIIRFVANVYTDDLDRVTHCQHLRDSISKFLMEEMPMIET